MTEERELPAALTGAELQAALLWAMRAEADREGRTLPDDLRLCCASMETDTAVQRYWTAAMTERRVQVYFSAFSARGLRLRRLTICPRDGGTLAPLIAAARDPQMPWEERGCSSPRPPRRSLGTQSIISFRVCAAARQS